MIVMTIRRLFTCCLVAAATVAAPGTPVAQGTDADFLLAKAAFDKGDSSALASLAPSLRGHVLEPYVAYWQLKFRIDIAGVEPGKAVQALGAERISATVTPYAQRHLRFGCGLAVDEEDVDAAVANVARIARRG